jgi:hypothetical protein
MRRGQLKEVQRIAPMRGIVSAHRVVSPALVSSVLDQVRTRVLSVTLEIEQIAPDAGEPGVSVTDLNTVTHIINTYIYCDGNTMRSTVRALFRSVFLSAGTSRGCLTQSRQWD